MDPRLEKLINAAVEDPELAKKIVEADPSILELRKELGETALHFLAVENYASGVQVLIDLGASVHVVNEFGSSPLDEAEFIMLPTPSSYCGGRGPKTSDAPTSTDPIDNETRKR
jgi:hypothetical protein